MAEFPVVDLEQPEGYGYAGPPSGKVDQDDNFTPDKPVETVPHLVLELEGDRQQFRSSQHANQFLLVRHADDLAVGGFPTVRAVTILALGQVVREERTRLEGYLADHGSADDYADALYEALSDCWQGETMLPLVPSLDSSEPTD